MQGRSLTDEFVKKVLPNATAEDRLYVYNKARAIADKVRAQKQDFKNDTRKLAKAVLDAETDLYYDNKIDALYQSAREGGAEWQYARNKLAEQARRERDKRISETKGLSPDELTNDIVGAIRHALEAEKSEIVS